MLHSIRKAGEPPHSPFGFLNVLSEVLLRLRCFAQGLGQKSGICCREAKGVL
jgi:hypothetical protein